MTDLEKGILVSIDPFEFKTLENKKGYLSFENYPDEYKKISLPDEVGRFLFFRFILRVKDSNLRPID